MRSYRWGILAVLLLLGYALYRDDAFAPRDVHASGDTSAWLTAQYDARWVARFDSKLAAYRKPVMANAVAKPQDIFPPQKVTSERFQTACDKTLLEYSGCAAGAGFEPTELGDNFKPLKLKVSRSDA